MKHSPSFTTFRAKVTAAYRRFLKAKSEAFYVGDIKRALREMALGNEAETPLFVDSIHAVTVVSHIGEQATGVTLAQKAGANHSVGNELFQISSGDDLVILTGLQLDDIAKQWLAFREGKPIENKQVQTDRCIL